VNTAEELKRVVAEPLVEDALRRLKEATETSRADVERLCGLLRKVAEIFSPERARAYDLERLGRAVTQAEGRKEQLGRELTELQWKDARA
jgi:predicted GNAT family N-acyltransferase